MANCEMGIELPDGELQNRFHPSPLDRARTWQELLYTPRNPVCEEIAIRAVGDPWSSARAHAGLAHFPEKLSPAPWANCHASEQWAEILEVGFRNHGPCDRIRHALASGRSAGRDAFIEELEARLRRALRPSKGGRPRAILRNATNEPPQGISRASG